jgi:hypothetical protein
MVLLYKRVSDAQGFDCICEESFEDEVQATFADYASDNAGDLEGDVEESALELEEHMCRPVYTPTNSTHLSHLWTGLLKPPFLSAR